MRQEEQVWRGDRPIETGGDACEASTDRDKTRRRKCRLVGCEGKYHPICADTDPELIATLLQSLHGALVANLQRAQRDNDLVYMAPVPPATQLAAIAPAPMVKATVPTQVENSLDWVIKQDGGALFSGLVPYGVHVALSQ